MKCYTGTSYRCGFKLKEIKENGSKRNLCQFLKLSNTGKIYRTSIHTKYRYTYKEKKIKLCFTNSIQYGSFRILKRRRRIRTQVPNSVVKLRGLIPPGKTGDQALPMLLVNWSAEFVISTTDPLAPLIYRPSAEAMSSDCLFFIYQRQDKINKKGEHQTNAAPENINKTFSRLKHQQIKKPTYHTT